MGPEFSPPATALLAQKGGAHCCEMPILFLVKLTAI